MLRCLDKAAIPLEHPVEGYEDIERTMCCGVGFSGWGDGCCCYIACRMLPSSFRDYYIIERQLNIVFSFGFF